MSIFDEQARLAGVKVLCKTECNFPGGEDCPCCWPEKIAVHHFVNANAVLGAAEASLRERGKLPDYIAGDERGEALEEAAKAAELEWFAGDRHRYASVLGPAIVAAIRALRSTPPAGEGK